MRRIIQTIKELFKTKNEDRIVPVQGILNYEPVNCYGLTIHSTDGRRVNLICTARSIDDLFKRFITDGFIVLSEERRMIPINNVKSIEYKRMDKQLTGKNLL